MYIRTNRKVQVTAKNVHNRRTKTITIYDVDCEEVIQKFIELATSKPTSATLTKPPPATR